MDHGGEKRSSESSLHISLIQLLQFHVNQKGTLTTQTSAKAVSALWFGSAQTCKWALPLLMLHPSTEFNENQACWHTNTNKTNNMTALEISALLSTGKRVATWVSHDLWNSTVFSISSLTFQQPVAHEVQLWRQQFVLCRFTLHESQLNVSLRFKLTSSR